MAAVAALWQRFFYAATLKRLAPIDFHPLGAAVAAFSLFCKKKMKIYSPYSIGYVRTIYLYIPVCKRIYKIVMICCHCCHTSPEPRYIKGFESGSTEKTLPQCCHCCHSAATVDTAEMSTDASAAMVRAVCTQASPPGQVSIAPPMSTVDIYLLTGL